jgi:hypothetical protein
MNKMSEKKERWIFLFLGLSFAIYALFHTTALFEELSLPIPITLTMTALSLGLFCLAVIISIGMSEEDGGLFPAVSQKWIVLLVLSILLMSAVGLYLNNPLYLFYIDFEGVIILFGSILLGARRKNWEHIDRLVILLLAYAVIVNAASLPLIRSIAREDAEHSVTNKLQVLLWPVMSYIYLFKYRARRLDKIIIMSAFVLFIIEQVLFQKRMPSIRIIFTLLLMTYIQNISTNPNFWSYLGTVVKRVMLFFIPVIIGGLIITNTVGLKMSDSLKMLNERATGKYGFVRTVIYDGRVYITYVVLQDIITDYSFILGKGFGGYIIDSRLHYFVEAEGGQFNGTSQIEIGQTWPVWKGGLLFWLSINALYLSLAFSFRKYRNSNFSLACWAFVLTQFVFLMGDNIWTSPLQIYLILLGASIGHLLGRNHEQENNLGGRLDL